MTTAIYEKVKQEIKQELIQEFVLPILKEVEDSEGKYKEEFVKRVLRAAQETPIYSYNPKKFLKQISE